MSGIKLILGFGVTGLSIAKYFSNKKIEYKIFDTRNKSDIDSLQISNLEQDILYFKNYDDMIFDGIDEIIISPGFDKDHPILKDIYEREIPISTDIDIFKGLSKRPIISVTGTNGKTTVVSMIEHVLCSLGSKSIACGNNGVPPLGINPDDYDYIILELSSYQLENMRNHESYISMITNIDYDHLERHITMHHYLNVKLNIFNSCKYPLINISMMSNLKDYNYRDILITYGLSSEGLVLSGLVNDKVSYDNKYIKYSDLRFEHQGIHNLENILGVCSITSLLNIPLADSLRIIRGFIHLPHRIELVKHDNNINWYNDSKSTNTASTKAALEHLDKDIILILGGALKKMDYKILSELINEKVKLLVFIGENKNYIKKQLTINTPVIDAHSITDAVLISRDNASNKDNILFSPASPSFDMFKNFEERGEAFKKAIKNNVT
tara:strand:- start:329 stop:1642 length:1314 start_codon:yes stop_codon:yes gene_type:complete